MLMQRSCTVPWHAVLCCGLLHLCCDVDLLSLGPLGGTNLLRGNLNNTPSQTTPKNSRTSQLGPCERQLKAVSDNSVHTAALQVQGTHGTCSTHWPALLL